MGTDDRSHGRLPPRFVRPIALSAQTHRSTFLDGGSAFLSRKAYLGAPAELPTATGAAGCVATTTATVTTAGLFAPLVRFEPLCRAPACFETQFMVTVTQAGAPRFAAVYGALGTLDLRDGTGTVIDHAITWQGSRNRVLRLA